MIRTVIAILYSWYRLVLVRATIVVVKHHDRSNLGQRNLFRLQFPHYSPTSQKVKTETQAGKEPGHGS